MSRRALRRRAHRELIEVHLPKKDRPFGIELRRDRRIKWRAIGFEHLRGRRRREAARDDIVFEREGNALELSYGLARCAARVALLRLGSCALSVEREEGADLVVLRLDAGERLFDELARRHLSGAERLERRREIARRAHPSPPRIFGTAKPSSLETGASASASSRLRLS